jgi:hypothetical protein
VARPASARRAELPQAGAAPAGSSSPLPRAATGSSWSFEGGNVAGHCVSRPAAHHAETSSGSPSPAVQDVTRRLLGENTTSP